MPRTRHRHRAGDASRHLVGVIMHDRHTHGRTSTSIVVLIGGIVCGTAGVAVARFAPDASPVTVGAVRLAIGGPALAIIALAAGHRPSALAGHMRWIVAGALAVVLYQVCFFTGTSRTGVALATVVALGSAPAISGVIDAVLLRRPPSRRWAIGTALAIAGIALIVGSQPSAATDLIGIVSAIAAGAAWAVYALICQRRIATGLDSTVCMAGMFGVAAVLVVPALVMGDVSWVGTPDGAALAVYLGVATIAVVYTCYGFGLRTLSPPTVLTLTLVEPLTAAVLATVVLDQHLDARGWIGVAAVIVALVITTSAATATRQPPTNAAMRRMPSSMSASASANEKRA